MIKIERPPGYGWPFLIAVKRGECSFRVMYPVPRTCNLQADISKGTSRNNAKAISEVKESMHYHEKLPGFVEVPYKQVLLTTYHVTIDMQQQQSACHDYSSTISQ